MSTKTRLRAWFHRFGIHAFCRSKTIPAMSFVPLRGGEWLDVTNQGAIDRVVHY